MHLGTTVLYGPAYQVKYMLMKRMLSFSRLHKYVDNSIGLKYDVELRDGSSKFAGKCDKP